MNNYIAVAIASVLLAFSGSGVRADANEPPSMEFLEFLGEWESSDGQWMDPLTINELQENEMQVIKSSNVIEDQNDE